MFVKIANIVIRINRLVQRICPLVTEAIKFNNIPKHGFSFYSDNYHITGYIFVVENEIFLGSDIESKRKT